MCDFNLERCKCFIYLKYNNEKKGKKITKTEKYTEIHESDSVIIYWLDHSYTRIISNDFRAEWFWYFLKFSVDFFYIYWDKTDK